MWDKQIAAICSIYLFREKKKHFFFNVSLIYDELSFFFLSSVSRQHKLSNSAAVYSRTQIEDLFEIYFEIFSYKGKVGSKLEI